MADHPDTDWTAWVQQAHNATQPMNAWVDTLVDGNLERVQTLSRRYPLNADDQKKVRHRLLGDAAFHMDAVELSMYVAPWPGDWLATWLREEGSKAMEGQRLEQVLTWWINTPLEPTDEHMRTQVMDQGRRVLFKEFLDKAGKAPGTIDLLARMTPFDPSWTRRHGTIGTFIATIMDFAPQAAGQTYTTDFSVDELCTGLRIAMNHAYGRSLIWGIGQPQPASAWRKWDNWLADDSRRQEAWTRMRVEDEQDTALAQTWINQHFPDGSWESAKIMFRSAKTGQVVLDIRSLLDHPYFGECSGRLNYSEDERRDFHKLLLDSQAGGGDPLLFLKQTALWLSRHADRLSTEGHSDLADAYAAAPVGRRLPCPPDLMSLGMVSQSSWVKTLGMATAGGTSAVLRALDDARVRNAFRPKPEELLGWVKEHGKVRAWRSPDGYNLLATTLGEGWKTQSNPALSPNIAKGFVALAPEWLTEPQDPARRCLLDWPLTDSKALTYIRRELLEQQLPANDTVQAPSPTRRF